MYGTRFGFLLCLRRLKLVFQVKSYWHPREYSGLTVYALVGDIAYHSRISERIERLPVAVSFLGPPGMFMSRDLAWP